MIQYIEGDLLATSERIILHGCNAQGVMGSGVAKAIKAKWPEAFDLYKKTYDWYNFADSGLRVGMVVPCLCRDGKIIANGITQEFYGRDPKKVYVSYTGIRQVLYGTRMLMNQYETKSVAMPKIGAGLGNGDWTVIEKIINEVFNDEFTVKVYVI